MYDNDKPNLCRDVPRGRNQKVTNQENVPDIQWGLNDVSEGFLKLST